MGKAPVGKSHETACKRSKLLDQTTRLGFKVPSRVVLEFGDAISGI